MCVLLRGRDADLGGKSQPLDLGRGERLYKLGQRRAMDLRDQHCRAEGCDIPAAWCQVHHVVPWADGGSTDVTSMALVCAFDHPLLDQGWVVAVEGGRVTWTAPPWLDPDQVPRVNLLRHPPDPAQPLPFPPLLRPRRAAARAGRREPAPG